MSFGPFLAILQCITSKNSKNYPKIGPPNKTPFLQKSQKTQIFYFRRAINLPKMSKKSKYFCQTTSHTLKRTEKNFYGHWNNIREMNFRFLKKNVSTEIQTRLKSLPKAKRSKKHVKMVS